MTTSILILLLLLLAAVLLFTTEWLPVDIVTLLLLVALSLTGILSPEEAFSGFANGIIIILASVFVLSAALLKTGVMDWLAHALYRVTGSSPSRVVLALMSLSAVMSAFLNNTTTTAVLMPASFDLARRSKVSPSLLLMPLAFASILGGTCTLVGTSTNVAASGLLQELGFEPFGLFEFAPVGLVVVSAGILWMTVIGYRLLPERVEGELGDKYEIDEYLSALLVPAESSLAGQSVSEAALGRFGVTLVAITVADGPSFPTRRADWRRGTHSSSTLRARRSSS